MSLEKIDLGMLDKEPDVRGSVQDLYRISREGKDYLLCRTSESGSVFDVGTIFSVPRSGLLRTMIRHAIYTGLGKAETWRALTEDDIRSCYKNGDIARDLWEGGLLEEFRSKGAGTHHLGMVDGKTGEVVSDGFPSEPSNMVLIEAFPVIHPERFSMWGKHAWDYSKYLGEKKKVVALENIFRLGNPGGSSLLGRYERAKAEGEDAARKFMADMGLKEEPVAWTMMRDMLYDCTTKYEPSDRHLSWQETVLISGVPAELYGRVARTLSLCTIYVKKFFGEMGLTLWDIKWEVAVDGERIAVVDTIDPDSVRVTGSVEYKGKRCHIHFNKQAIRDYYRLVHGEWYGQINECKRLAKTDSAGRPFMEIYREKVGKGECLDIPDCDDEYVDIQSSKYELMAAPLADPSKKGGIKDKLAGLMEREINFYDKRGKLDEFLAMNSEG